MKNEELESAQSELSQYVGTPKCMDCKWKLGSDITNNCGCMGSRADIEKYKKAFSRARELQQMISEANASGQPPATGGETPNQNQPSK